MSAIAIPAGLASAINWAELLTAGVSAVEVAISEYQQLQAAAKAAGVPQNMIDEAKARFDKLGVPYDPLGKLAAPPESGAPTPTP